MADRKTIEYCMLKVGDVIFGGWLVVVVMLCELNG